MLCYVAGCRAVVGCADVRAPPGGWAVRNDDTTSTLGCNRRRDDDVTMTSSSARTWQLVCVGRAWRGVTHNCTSTTSHQHGSTPTPHRVSLAHLYTSSFAASFYSTLFPQTVLDFGGIPFPLPFRPLSSFPSHSLRSDLFCVEWDVKPCSIHPIPPFRPP